MLYPNMATTSQGASFPCSTSAHGSTSEHDQGNGPTTTPDQLLRATLVTLLDPAMARMDKLGETQTEMMRMKRELMGVVLSLTLRLDAVAATQVRAVDNRRPDSSDQNNRNGKTTTNEEGNEHRQRCHCGLCDTLKESISRGVAEAKAEILTSISALSDHFDTRSKEIGKLLKLHSPPSPMLSQQNLDSQVVTTDTSPTSCKRRRVDFEREDIMMDGTNQDTSIGPLHVPAEQFPRSNALERIKDPTADPPPERNLSLYSFSLQCHVINY